MSLNLLVGLCFIHVWWSHSDDIDFKLITVPGATMYSLFRRTNAPRNIGTLFPPEHNYLKRMFEDALGDIMEYYHRYPKRVDSEHLFCRILTLLPRRWDLDDRRYLQYIDDASEPISRNFNFVSPTYKGRVYESGVTLGKLTDEVVIDHHDGIPTDLDIQGAWRYWQPYRFLTHTRYDLHIPVPNNRDNIKGGGVGVIDIPLMALQYRRWLTFQKHKVADQKEAVFRFIGGFVLPNTARSYLDIAVFNRLTRIANNQPLNRYPSPHPFYLTDHSSRIDNYCKKIIENNDKRRVDIETFMSTTPMIVEDSLFGLMQRLPKQPVTHNNEWAIIAARLPYLRYIVDHGIVADKGDRSKTNELYETIMESFNDRIYTSVGSSNYVKGFKEQLMYLKETIETKGHGW